MFLPLLGLRIAVTLTYDGTRAENEARCLALLALLERHEWEDPTQRGLTWPYWTFLGVATPHQVSVLKVIHNERNRPPSDGLLLQGGAVIGVNAVLSRESRNYGLSRGFAYHHADLLLELDDVPSKLEIAAALTRAERYTDETWGRTIKRAAFEKVGYLDKDAPLLTAREHYKQRVEAVQSKKGFMS